MQPVIDVRNNACYVKHVEVITLDSINITTARQNLYKLVNEINKSHRPVLITGKSANAVLLSAEDWSAIQETLYLTSIPGMTESIKEGVNTPIEECISADEIDW